MASKSVNITISTPFGDLQIYSDPKEQAKAERLISKTPHILTKGYSEGSEKFGNQLLRIVRKCLTNGMPPPNSGVKWDPHSISTIKKYGEHTLLNYTGQYKRSVRIVKQKNRTFVGLPPNLHRTLNSGKTSKRTLNQIAIMLEYGSRDGNLPSRPLWKPAFKAAGGKEALRKHVVNAIRKELRKYM